MQVICKVIKSGECYGVVVNGVNSNMLRWDDSVWDAKQGKEVLSVCDPAFVYAFDGYFEIGLPQSHWL